MFKLPPFKSLVAFWSLILIMCISIVFVSCSDGENVEEDAEVPEVQEIRKENPQQIKGFVQFIEEDHEELIGIDHDYTNKSIAELAKAIEWLSNEHDVDVAVDREMLMNKADELQKDPYSLKHADIIAEVFTEATNALDKIQNQVKPDMNKMCEDLRRAADAIDPAQPLLEQKNDVRSFFNQASSVIQALNE